MTKISHLARHERKIITEAREQLFKRTIIKDSSAQSEQEALNLLIASGITRFGILFMMIFIMQVLVNLYRYTMRLSAYYLSQADAFLLAGEDSKALMELLPALSPAQVDFGKPPTTPMGEVSKLLELANKARAVT